MSVVTLSRICNNDVAVHIWRDLNMPMLVDIGMPADFSFAATWNLSLVACFGDTLYAWDGYEHGAAWGLACLEQDHETRSHFNSSPQDCTTLFLDAHGQFGEATARQAVADCNDLSDDHWLLHGHSQTQEGSLCASHDRCQCIGIDLACSHAVCSR